MTAIVWRVLSSEGAPGRKEGGKVAIMLEKSNREHKALDGGRKEEGGKNGNVLLKDATHREEAGPHNRWECQWLASLK